jgi:hypothetical protein
MLLVPLTLSAQSRMPFNAPTMKRILPAPPAQLCLHPGPAKLTATWNGPSVGTMGIDYYVVYVNRQVAIPKLRSFVLTGLPTCAYPSGSYGRSYEVGIAAHGASLPTLRTAKRLGYVHSVASSRCENAVFGISVSLWTESQYSVI